MSDRPRSEGGYEYFATVVRWVDGDTVDLRLDLGFRMTTEQRFRLLGVNTPERGQAGYAEAKDWCEAQAPAGCDVMAVTFKADKYGRWLVQLLTLDERSLNAGLLERKLAVPYGGGARG